MNEGIITAIAEADERIIQRAKDTLTHKGYVVHKDKSWRNLLERVRVAEIYRQCAEEDAQRARHWAQTELHNDIRDLMARCTFLYGVARARGATVDELAGGWQVVGTNLPTETASTVACQAESVNGPDRCDTPPFIIQLRDGQRHITKFLCPHHGWVDTRRLKAVTDE